MTPHKMTSETIVDLSEDNAAPTPADKGVIDVEALEVLDERDGDKLPEGTRLNPDGTVTLTLSETIKIPSKGKDGVVKHNEFKTLTCRRLRGKDQKAMRNFDVEKRFNYGLAVMCNLHPAMMDKLLDEMITYDSDRLGKVFIYFFQNGPKTLTP
jgi:hypothetical protein